MNRPLERPSRRICWATSFNANGSVVRRRTKSADPGAGSGGGWNAAPWAPAISPSCLHTAAMCRSFSCARPTASAPCRPCSARAFKLEGMLNFQLNVLAICCAADSATPNSVRDVAVGASMKLPMMKPWSSCGASSLFEKLNGP